MASFELLETIICSIEIRDSSSVLVDPATSIEIQIQTQKEGTEVVAEVAMTNDSTGKYHFDYSTTGSEALGGYRVRYKLTDGARITIEDDFFELVT